MTIRRTGRALRVMGLTVATVSLVLLGTVFSPFVPRIEAVTLQALDVGQMTQYSQSVVVARTLSLSTRLVPGKAGSGSLGSVETVVQLRVLDTLKGAPGDHRTLVLPGGTAQGVTLVVDWVPGFQAGETSALFIDAQGRIVGGPQGKVAVVDGWVPAYQMSLAGLRSWVTTGSTGVVVQAAAAGDVSPGVPLYAAAGFPLIDSISPRSASAGTNSRVTIKGSGFGTTQGSGRVAFWYGRPGHPTIDAPVVSWSDTAIVCVVPTATIDNYRASAGSGPVTVTSAGGQTSNNYDFHVTFSYVGARWPAGGYTFRINPNTADMTGEETLVKAAASTWNAASNFRFVDGGACTTTSAKTGDGYNDIFWSSTALPAGVAAQASRWSIAGNDAALVEVDITFNDSTDMPPWGDGSNGTVDVQAVALHEMGHGVGLSDLYGPEDKSKVMYGVDSDWSAPARALSDDDRAGAAYIYGGGSGGGGGGGDDEGGGDSGGNGGDATLFSDLKPENPYFLAITDLAGKGIITGFSDGTFRPDQSVTRQQFAKMIVKTLGLPVTGQEVNPFTDVAAHAGSDPFYPAKYVAVCAANGITTGKTATTFAPKDSITRQQLITMVARAGGLADPVLAFSPVFLDGQFSLAEHYDNARKAEYVGLLDRLVGIGVGYDFKAPSTRAECAQLLSTLWREQPLEGARVLFADDFAHNEMGWPEFQWPDWRWLMDASAGRYNCTIDTAGTLTVSCLPFEWGDGAVEVDAHCASAADDVNYGIVFRSSEDQQTFYGFTVSSRGYWELWRRTGGAWGDKELLAGKSSGLINRGRAWNHLRVSMKGAVIELSVNGNQLYTFTKGLGSSGLLGLAAMSPPDPLGQTLVTFDNFKIWKVK